jgi:hypothetical protein
MAALKKSLGQPAEAQQKRKLAAQRAGKADQAAARVSRKRA